EVCEAGAIVSEGDVLMKIDPTDYQLEVERLTRLRDQEYRALGEVDQEMINTKRSIDVAREDVRLKQRDVDRQTSLSGVATSQTEVDKAKSALVQSSQSLVTLENQLDLQRARRIRLEASEQLAATQLRVAEVNLERCVVKAPLSGVIVSEEADLNTFVNRGTPLITIEDISKVEVAASMRMDQLYWVLDQTASAGSAGGVAQNVNYDLPDTPAIIEYEVSGRQNAVHRWQGTLVSFDGIGIDPNTRTVPVRILVDDPRHFVDEDGKLQKADRTTALLRGMFVRVRLQLQPTTDLIVIPARALRPGNRVWKFSEDEEVLDEAVAEAKEVAEKWAAGQLENTAESAENPASPDAEDAKDGAIDESSDDDDPEFDPTGWSAGLVTFSKTVYPVDALRLSGDEVTDDPASQLAQGERKLWVCEASKSDLQAGDYVVVSPLDAIPPTGLPVRGKVEE
ncbi:MAG: HlyD family efflux transporter periplasmic adaptor subunit, partial [Planctomycetota bacterium]